MRVEMIVVCIMIVDCFYMFHTFFLRNLARRLKKETHTHKQTPSLNILFFATAFLVAILPCIPWLGVYISSLLSSSIFALTKLLAKSASNFVYIWAVEFCQQPATYSGDIYSGCKHLNWYITWSLSIHSSIPPDFF